VITDKFLVNQCFDQNQQGGMKLKDQTTLERSTGDLNRRYPANLNRRINELPFSMIILDSKEVGIELIHANHPNAFNGFIFIRDENMANIMTGYYQKIWETSSDDVSFITSESLSKRYLVPSQ
jgi:hypothetical protein